MSKNILCGLAALVLQCLPAAPVLANEGYLQDSRQAIARGAFGGCWRSGSWSAADSVPACDPRPAPPVTRLTAPPLVAQATPTPPPAPPAPPPPCDFDVTLSGDDGFGFDSATLHAPAEEQLDGQVLQRLADCSRVSLIGVTGHADPLGTASYNQRLSEKRAGAVAAWLASHGAAGPIETRGAGAREPLAQCPVASMATVVACNAPNRRVEIAVHGLARE